MKIKYLTIINISLLQNLAESDYKLKKINKKITSNKHVLVENELKNLQTFDSSLFIGRSYFNNDGAQLYLIFQPVYYTLKRLGDNEKGLP